MEKEIKSIGVLGGSGALGTGLSFRLAKAGYNVVIGSRNPVQALKKISLIDGPFKELVKIALIGFPNNGNFILFILIRLLIIDSISFLSHDFIFELIFLD